MKAIFTKLLVLALILCTFGLYSCSKKKDSPEPVKTQMELLTNGGKWDHVVIEAQKEGETAWVPFENQTYIKSFTFAKVSETSGLYEIFLASLDPDGATFKPIGNFTISADGTVLELNDGTAFNIQSVDATTLVLVSEMPSEDKNGVQYVRTRWTCTH